MQWKKDEHKLTTQDFETRSGIAMKENLEEEKVPVYKKPVFYIVFLFSFIMVGLVAPLIYSVFFNNSVVVNPNSKPTTKATTTPVDNPFNRPPDAISPPELITDGEKLIAEKMFFAHFYEKEEMNFKTDFNDYSFPINVKTDVTNYYDVSRKINLDPYLDDLNNNGFAVLRDDSGVNGDDFFKAYEKLVEFQVPTVVTNDFLFYYYQNILKKIYRDIEESVFYDNLYEINQDLFYIAASRYRTRAAEVGFANDPILEALRMEASFFAVALKLLQPAEGQISKTNDLKDGKLFTPSDVARYGVVVPDYLKDGDIIDKEVALIRSAQKNDLEKSPVMLYYRDYGDFIVPDQYRGNAKLNNFYLALNWMNSVFPLYYKGDTCEDCLLDEYDWKISMTAAAFLSRDFSLHQDIKNKWSVIYKFISFFKGLRNDLTYLDYDKVFTDLYGPDYEIEEFFAPESEKFSENLKLVTDKLADIEFLDIQGGISNNNEMRADAGMRILQDYYWPNDFIFNSLTGEDIMGGAKKEDKRITTCFIPGGDSAFRCKGTGYDMIALVHDEVLGNDFYNESVNYSGYTNKLDSLKSRLGVFNDFVWNSNIFWINMDIGKSILSYPDINKPNFMKTDKWRNERDYNTFLGGWVNLHLPEVNIIGQDVKTEKIYFGDGSDCDHSIVELNFDFINELIAKNKMLIDSLTAMRVVNKTSIVSTQLTTLDTELRRIRAIGSKEMTKTSFNEDDCGFLKSLTRRKAERIYVKNESSLDLNENILKQELNGTKMMLLVYTDDKNRKIMAIGPIFNYKNTK